MHKILYLGLDSSRYNFQGELVHCPIIKTVPILPLTAQALLEWPSITHVLFTSPSAVNYWPLSLLDKQVIVVGNGTASQLSVPPLIAPFATQEGVIALLETVDLSSANVLWPRSSKSRAILVDYLTAKKVRFQALDLYHTQTNIPAILPDLNQFDELVFTSPSTVHAFVEIFGPIPKEKKLTPIGPVTAKLLQIIR